MDETTNLPSHAVALPGSADNPCAITRKELFAQLCEALPYIARVTGGYATVTDRDGVRLHTVDSEGKEHPELVGRVFQPERAPAESSGIAGSDFVSDAESWVLPLGDFVLACSNIERVERDKCLLAAMRRMLPVIARMVGGEAVIFDMDGRRIASYSFSGTENVHLIGLLSDAAARAMHSNSPVVGPSVSEEGAVAVRFPITSTFGFGFNNIQSVQREKRLLDEVRKGRSTRYSFTDIVGESEAVHQVKELAATVACGASSVILYGETGTGKELFAQAIHNGSKRWDKPFVAINCGALPASIIESYLFGYESGAFTGARKSGNIGAFEQANGGTVFLDEVSEMDFALQSKILRVLQEKELMRIGGSRPTPVDIRVLAATNRDIQRMVQDGAFREDLFYRLNVVQLLIPPLRERVGDIPLLVQTFIQRNNQLFGKFVFSAAPETLALLQAHAWPGNIRELQNCIEYSFNIINTKEQIILPVHLPRYLQEGPALPAALPANEGSCAVRPLTESLAEAERQCLLAALEATNQCRHQTAQLLGISTTTLWRRMKALGILPKIVHESGMD